jgi:hypothetical protein
MNSSSEEIKALTYHILIRTLDPLVTLTILIQLPFEILDSLKRFLLLGLHGLLFRELVVVVYCAGEGGEGGGDLTLEGRGGCGCFGKVVEIFAE